MPRDHRTAFAIKRRNSSANRPQKGIVFSQKKENLQIVERYTKFGVAREV